MGKLPMVRPISRCAVQSLESRRLLAATDFDTTFGNAGKALLDFAGPTDDYLDSVALTTDNKILLVGNSSGGDARPTLARFNLDGTPDTTFGTGGKIRFTAG